MDHKLSSPLALVAAIALVTACGSSAPPPPDGAEPAAVAPDTTARALAFLEAHPELVGGGAGQAFQPRAALADDDGAAHVRFDRSLYGARVLGGDVVVHARTDGTFDRATHTLRTPLPDRVAPTLRAAEAILAAGVAADEAKRADLVVMARRGLSRVAWEVVREGRAADGTPEEVHAVVDAESGLVLERWDAIRTLKGTGHALYAGDVPVALRKVAGGYELADTGRGGMEIVDAQDADGSADARVVTTTKELGDGTPDDRASAAVDAAYGLAATWDYFAKVHGRKGPAGDGVGLAGRVHFGQGFANAFFSPACACVNFGDGARVGSRTLLPLVALDVVAHEATHAMTHATAGLVYSGESGALDEATSDIFAAMIEHHAKNPHEPGNYTIGEAVVRPKGHPLRDMAAPEVGCWDEGVASLDPHYGSGIGNHFFYLLAEGSTSSTTTCNGSEVVGIGREKAARIWYRALTAYMTSDTDYAGARAATLDAATDLFGAKSAERARVAAAWAAVGIR